MLSWIVDNATLVYLFLGLAAVALAMRWRATRQGGYAIALGVVAGLIALVVVLCLSITTDRKLLIGAVAEVAQQLEARNFDAAFQHFADEVRLEMSGQSGMVRREQLARFARDNIQRRKVSGISVSEIDIESIDGPKAVLTFMLRASEPRGFARCTAECVRLGERDWRVRGLKLEVPLNVQVPFPQLP
jgi:hypothetical protein